MPAKPRRLPELRRDPDARRARDDERRELVERRAPRRELERTRDAGDLLDELDRVLERPAGERLELGRRERLELREWLELERPDDFLRRWDLVSPLSARILLTVRAATSSARPP